MVFESSTASRMFSKMKFPSETDRAKFVIESIQHRDPEVTETLAESGAYGDFLVLVEPADAGFLAGLEPPGLGEPGSGRADGRLEVPALLFAALSREPRKVQALLLNGADPNAATERGVTALMLACAQDCQEVVQALLHWDGLEVDARTRWGQTALHYAARACRQELVAELVRQLADPNVADAQGRTPLHEAVEADSLELVLLLMRFGASPTGLFKPDGVSALQEAVSRKRERIVAAMLDWGAGADVACTGGELNSAWFDLSREEWEQRRRDGKTIELREKSNWFARIFAGLKHLVVAGPGDPAFGKQSPRHFLDDLF